MHNRGQRPLEHLLLAKSDQYHFLPAFAFAVAAIQRPTQANAIANVPDLVHKKANGGGGHENENDG